MQLVIDGHTIWLPAVAALGVCVGLVAGTLGVGGGFLLVPLLNVVLDVPWPAAVGTGLCQTIATALGAFLRYRRLGLAEWRFDVLLIGGSLLGVDAGTRVLSSLQGVGLVHLWGRELSALRVTVMVVYAALFTVLSWVMWSRPPSDAGARAPGALARLRIGPSVALPVAGIDAVSGLVVAYVGLVIGVLGGLLGIGGGVVLIPVMLYGFGFDIKKAAGTGILMVLSVAVVGTVQHARLGHVHLGLAVTVMVGAALAAQVGAGFTAAASPYVLRRGFAVVLLVTVVAIVVKLLH